MPSKPYNVAIIGYGLSAKIFHIPFITPLSSLKLYGIVQRHPKPDDDCTKDFPGIKRWASSDEMFEDKDVDIVVVTTLPESHFDLCKQALESGKHVVVEKPFVPTSEEASSLLEISRKTGKLLTVYQNRRWDSDFLTLKSIMPKLGGIVSFETHFDRHAPTNPQTWRQQPRPGVGQIYDLGTHLMDQVYHLFGSPQSITAFLGNQRGEAGEHVANDSFLVVLKYNDGMVAKAEASVVSPEEEQLRYWVRGTEGSFKKYHLDCQEDQLKAGMRPGDEGYAIEPESHHGTLTTMVDGNPKRAVCPTVEPATYVEYYRIFVDAIEGKGEVPVSARDARDVIRLVELAKESSKTGRTLEM